MKKSRRRSKMLVASAVVAVLAVMPPVAAKPVGQVEDLKVGKGRLFITKSNGKTVGKTLADNVKIRLKGADGTSKGDLNDLARGARILNLKDTDDDNEIEVVVLKELPSGSTDCSFDTDEDADEDGESFDESWDCSLGFEDDESDEDFDCAFDSSRDFSEGDGSMDLSWDCSYDYGDDTYELSWDCSMDASESYSSDAEEADAADPAEPGDEDPADPADPGDETDPSVIEVEGDVSFDCAWDSSEPLAGPLWVCSLDAATLSFECLSEELGASFGYAFDLSQIAGQSDLSFQPDNVEEGDEGDEDDLACSGDDESGYDCAFDGAMSSGACEVDWSTDHYTDANGGDTSGDLSYYCVIEQAPAQP